MKVKHLLIICTSIVTLISCKRDIKTVSELKSNKDSLSYAIGIITSQQVKFSFKDNVNKDLIIQAFYEGLDSTDLLMPIDDVPRVIQAYMKKVQDETTKELIKKEREDLEKKYSDWKLKNEDFLKQNTTKPNVETSSSGLQYVVLKKGSGDKAKLTDKIKVRFKSFGINGRELDNSFSKKPYEFTIKGSMKGLEEGFQLMSKGAKYKFFIPQNLGYGYSQKIPQIKPFSTLIYEVELLEILK